MFCEWRETDDVRKSDGRPYWVCAIEGCTRKVASVKPPLPAECLGPKCVHLGEQIGTVPCGCGSRDGKLPVFKCVVLGQCTAVTSNKPQRWEGMPIAVCLGCGRRETELAV